MITPTEIAQVLGTAAAVIGATFGGVWKLFDLRSTLSKKITALETSLTEAEKTVKAQAETIATMKDETNAWRRQRERLEDRLAERERRIDALEDRLYAGGGRR